MSTFKRSRSKFGSVPEWKFRRPRDTVTSGHGAGGYTYRLYVRFTEQRQADDDIPRDDSQEAAHVLRRHTPRPLLVVLLLRASSFLPYPALYHDELPVYVH